MVVAQDKQADEQVAGGMPYPDTGIFPIVVDQLDNIRSDRRLICMNSLSDQSVILCSTRQED